MPKSLKYNRTCNNLINTMSSSRSMAYLSKCKIWTFINRIISQYSNSRLRMHRCLSQETKTKMDSVINKYNLSMSQTKMTSSLMTLMKWSMSKSFSRKSFIVTLVTMMSPPNEKSTKNQYIRIQIIYSSLMGQLILIHLAYRLCNKYFLKIMVFNNRMHFNTLILILVHIWIK